MKELFRKLFTQHYDRLIAEGRDEVAAHDLATEEAYAEVGQLYADLTDMYKEKLSTQQLIL